MKSSLPDINIKPTKKISYRKRNDVSDTSSIDSSERTDMAYMDRKVNTVRLNLLSKKPSLPKFKLSKKLTT